MSRIYAVSPPQEGTGVVYCIHNLVTDKKYVGCTIDKIHRRIANHRKDRVAGINEDDCLVAEIERVSVDLLLDREDYWIKQLGTAVDGYNIKYRGHKNGRVQYGALAYNSSDWQVTFDDGRVVLYHSLTELHELGYDRSLISKVYKGKMNFHKDIIGVIKL